MNWTDGDFAVERDFAFAVLPEFGVGPRIAGGGPILAGDEDLPVDQQRGGMAGADGAILLPGDLARALIEAAQAAGAFVGIPGKDNSILGDERADTIAPHPLRIAEEEHTAGGPDQLPVVRVAGGIGIAEGHIDGSIGNDGRVDGEVLFLVRALIDAEAEVVTPEFLAGMAIQAEGEEGLLVIGLGLRGGEETVFVDHRRAGAPAWKLDSPVGVSGFSSGRRQRGAIAKAIGLRTTPTGPIGGASAGTGEEEGAAGGRHR